MVTPLDRAVGRTLRQVRRDAEVTQPELARRLGCSDGLVSLMETGNRRCSIDTMVRVCEICGVRPWEFMRGVDRYLKRPQAKRVKIESE